MNQLNSQAKSDGDEGSVKSATPSVARVNPFKAFIDQSKVGFVDHNLNDEAKSVRSLKVEPVASNAAAVSGYTDDEILNAWAQYLDDESGCLYWYNELTGEARWIEAEEQLAGDYEGAVLEGVVEQQPQEGDQAFPTLVLSSAWEKYYDDDGNPFYFNKETGVSEWEIPAGDVYVEGYTSGEAGGEMKIEMGQAHDTFDGLWMGEESVKGSSQKNEQKEDSKDAPTAEPTSGKQEILIIQHTESKEDSSRILKSVSSFKSVRSARSVGLPSPHHTPSMLRLMSKASFSNLVDLDAVAAVAAITPKGLSKKASFSASVKSMQPTVSFRLANSAPQIDNSLKPKSPLKRASKSGFQMLKEGATILREAADEKGDVWIEYQSAGDGPIFYALKNTVTGQWTKPQVFNDIDSGLRKKVPDADSSLEEASLGEIVDYFVMENSASPANKHPDHRYLHNHSSFDINNASFASLGDLPELKLKPPSKPPSYGSAITASQETPKSTTVRFEEPKSEEKSTTEDLDNSVQSLHVPDEPKSATGGEAANTSVIPPKVPSHVTSASPDIARDSKETVEPTPAANAAELPNDVDISPADNQNIDEVHARKAEALQLQIASIQAEAMLELQRLKERLDDARKEHSSTAHNASSEPGAVESNVDIGGDSGKAAVMVHEHAVSTTHNDDGAAVRKVVDTYVVETVTIEPADLQEGEGDIDWVEWYARSHVIHRQGPWIVLQDTATQRRFFRNQDTGQFQFEKPSEIEEIKENASHNPLLKSMTEKRLRESPAPHSVASGHVSRHTPHSSIGVVQEGSRGSVPASVVAQTPATKASHLSGQSPVVKTDDSVAMTISSKGSKSKLQGAAIISSPVAFPPTPTQLENRMEHEPTLKEKRPKSSTKAETRSSFLTNVDIVEVDREPTVPPSEKYNFHTEPNVNLTKELAFVEKAAAKELHEFWQRDYQNQDEESNVLLARLQALGAERQTDSYMGGKARHVSSI
eukprot:gene28874-34849_t